MAMDSDNELSNVSFDDGQLMNFPYKINKINDNAIVKHPKSILKCVVCGDNALGYNFDAISCESCKAFFRRTAVRPPEKVKCRGNGHCEVTVEKRKRCKKCRLEKCFRMGMRKEWILSEEEKRKKRSQVEENRRQKRQSERTQDSQKKNVKHQKIENSSSENTVDLIKTEDISFMTTTDWTRIEQVQYAYNESIKLNKVIGVPCFPATQHIHSTLELIRIPTYLASIRLITFLKKIPEFNLIDLEDRVILVKYNLLAVVFMHIALVYNPINDTYHESETEDPIFQGKDWIEILGDEFYRDLTDVTTKFLKIIKHDQIIVKTFLLLILFTKGFCGYDIAHEPTLNNYSVVFQIQNLYLESLYKYSLHQYGFKKTSSLFTNILAQLLSVQRLAIHLKDYVHDHINASQLSPLMQSVLQLTDSSSST